MGSSLFYNTSIRDERHNCYTSATRMRHERNECYMNESSATRVLHKRHECDTCATRVKNFDFDNETIENIFSHPCISYMANEQLQGEEQFHCMSYLLGMPRSHGKMRLKSASQKLNFVMAKVISSKSYTVDCSCKCP